MILQILKVMDSLEASNETVLHNCTFVFDSTRLKVLAALRASTGLFSTICCLAVVVLILLFKKYRFFSQRLILNVAVAAMIHSLSYTTARVNYYTVRPIEDPYCYFGGLFNLYMAVVELISIWFIAINIFSVGMCGKNISKFEPAYYVVTYCLPALWFWVPLWLQAFGTNGGWCEVKNVDEECRRFEMGQYLVLGLWLIPLFISTAVILLMLSVVLVKYLRVYYQHKWRGGGDADSYPQAAGRRALRNELRSLMSYPIVYFLLSIFTYINLIYRASLSDSESVSDVFNYFRVFTSPLRGAFIALAFALDRDTRNRLNCAHIKSACLECVDRSPKVYEVESTTMYSDREETYETGSNLTYNRIQQQ